MTRVLHVLDHTLPTQSGYSFRTRYVLRAERALGVDVAVVSSARHGATEAPVEEIDGVRHYRTALRASGLRGVELRIPYLRERVLTAALRDRILEAAAAERPDILHAHSPLFDGQAALAAGRTLGIPVVYEVRAFWEDDAVDKEKFKENSFLYRQVRKLETSVMKRASAVVTICEGLRRDIVGRGLPDGRVTVVKNGVDPEVFRPRPKDEALADKLDLGGRPVVGFVGSFFHYEGLPLLVRAAELLRSLRTDVRFVIVGGGEDETLLGRAIADAHLEHVFRLPGRVAHEEIDAYYSVMDVLVYPRNSRRITELVTPLKPLEAMAMGKVVLGSDVGGIRELVAECGTGHLFKAGDAAELARRLFDLLSDPVRLAREGQAARARVAETRGWLDTVRPILRVYAGCRPVAGAVAPTRSGVTA